MKSPNASWNVVPWQVALHRSGAVRRILQHVFQDARTPAIEHVRSPAEDRAVVRVAAHHERRGRGRPRVGDARGHVRLVAAKRHRRLGQRLVQPALLGRVVLPVHQVHELVDDDAQHVVRVRRVRPGRVQVQHLHLVRVRARRLVRVPEVAVEALPLERPHRIVEQRHVRIAVHIRRRTEGVHVGLVDAARRVRRRPLLERVGDVVDLVLRDVAGVPRVGGDVHVRVVGRGDTGRVHLHVRRRHHRQIPGPEVPRRQRARRRAPCPCLPSGARLPGRSGCSGRPARTTGTARVVAPATTGDRHRKHDSQAKRSNHPPMVARGAPRRKGLLPVRRGTPLRERLPAAQHVRALPAPTCAPSPPQKADTEQRQRPHVARATRGRREPAAASAVVGGWRGWRGLARGVGA